MNGAENNLAVFLAIAGAALVTYAFRFGGLLLSEKLPSTGKFKDFMEALPGTILVALVAPGIIAAGFWGCLAALSTALLVWRTGN
ncbi:MAG: AzlD domain-containing protein, partial [Desulfobacterales bacterium]|nr:AzlD domain-containing protein [Desulfobacterales bacterium]